MPHLIINHVIKATKSIKSTSGVSYGMLMTLVFKHFEVSLDGELMDDNALTWGAKNIVALKLSSKPGTEQACTCSDEEKDQNTEKTMKKKRVKRVILP